MQPVPTARPTTDVQPLPSRERPQMSVDQAPTREPAPQPSADAVEAAPVSPPTVPTAAASSPPTAKGRPDEGGVPWLWILLGTLAVALFGAFGWWRQRGPVSPVSVPRIERPTPVERAQPAPSAAPVATPRPAAVIADPAKIAPIPTPAKPAAVAFDSGPLHVAFEVRDITATLMAVTLNYRITLSNRGDAALAQVLIGGSFEAAAGNLAVERQLEPPRGQLPVAHEVESLSAGEVTELTGEIRVPLARLNPIRRGEQALFVPIARLHAAGTLAGGDRVIARQSVLLGRVSPDAELHPIHLEQGPRVYRDIGQRIIAPQAA